MDAHAFDVGLRTRTEPINPVLLHDAKHRSDPLTLEVLSLGNQLNNLGIQSAKVDAALMDRIQETRGAITALQDRDDFQANSIRSGAELHLGLSRRHHELEADHHELRKKHRTLWHLFLCSVVMHGLTVMILWELYFPSV